MGFGPVRPTSTAPMDAGFLEFAPQLNQTGISKPAMDGSGPAQTPSPGYEKPTPTPSNSYNEMAAAEARQRKARGRLATIYTSNFGVAPSPQVSTARKMLTGV